MTTSAVLPEVTFLAGGGEMGARCRALDWRGTPFGEPHTWPECLRIATSICLASRHGMIIWWGQELAMLYNDAFIPYAGPSKHPSALGKPGQETYPEIWDEIGPRLRRVMDTGEATYDDDQLLVIDRAGYPEETYWTYAYSAIRAADTSVAGVFTATTETTTKVISARREAVLRALAAHAKATTTEDACRFAAKTLTDAGHDVPFALIYLREGDKFRLAATSGLSHGTPLSPERIDADDASTDAAWPLGAAARAGVSRHIELSLSARELAPGGAWPERARSAQVIPIPAHSERASAGVLVLGVSPRRAFDESYRLFGEAVAQHLGNAVGAARAYQAEVERAKALAELDRAKTTFFSNISHEFRTPLTLMLGPLSDALHSPEKTLHHESLETVHRNGLRLLKLVNALLDFSRIEAGRTQASLERMDLAALTRDLASVFRSAVEKANIEYDVQVDAVGDVPVDPAMWEKIVLNLLSNALKHTFEGSIRVRLGAEADHVRLEVSDTGVGIPEDQQANIFKRFYRVENARARTHEGSGIGLALVKELVLLHQGDISLKSRPGAGTTFTVRIPTTTPLGASAQRSRSVEVRTDATAYVDDAIARPLRPMEGPSPASTMDHMPSPRSRGGRVLLVDDNVDMREYLARILRPHWDVDMAPDGEHAWDKILATPPDLVLSDVMMPKLDGFGLIKRLREHERTRNIPIILLSARAGTESSVEGLQAGADDYLVKPFSAPELLARVEVNIERTRMRAEANEQIRDVLESITDRCVAMNEDWVVTYQNQRSKDAMAQAFPGSGDIVGRNVWEALPQLAQTQMAARTRAVMETREPAHFEAYYEPTGTWSEVNIYRTHAGIVSYTRDITQRRRTEEALRSSESRKAAILEGALDSIITIDHDGVIVEFNPAAERTFGYSREEAVGQPMAGLIIPQEYRARHLAGMAHYLQTGQGPILGQRLKLPAMRRDGTIFPSELAIVRIPGEPPSFTGYLRDLTNETRAESDLEAARRRAAQNEKLSALGQLVSGVAHEIRTPLTYLMNNMYLIEAASNRLVQDIPPEKAPLVHDKLTPRLQEAKDGIERINRIVEDLRRFTRLETKKREDHTLDHLASQAFRLFEATNKSGVRVDAQFGATPAVFVDALQFQQVVLNLLQNAVEASSVDGTVTLRTSTEKDGRVAAITVSDRGHGMTPEVRARVFDPLYTTKSTGTGLGLSIVKRIVDDHQGTIHIQSAPGEGTTVTLLLPAST